METWRKYLLEKIQENGESWSDVIAVEKEAAIDEIVDANWPHHFWVWTGKNVYFPITCEGDFWVSVAPRNPKVDRLSTSRESSLEINVPLRPLDDVADDIEKAVKELVQSLNISGNTSAVSDQKWRSLYREYANLLRISQGVVSALELYRTWVHWVREEDLSAVFSLWSGNHIPASLEANFISQSTAISSVAFQKRQGE